MYKRLSEDAVLNKINWNTLDSPAYPIGTPADLGHLVLSEVGGKISVPTRHGHEFATWI